MRIRETLGTGEDVYKRFVWLEDRVDLPGYALHALAPDIGEEREHRWLKDGHGMVLDREKLHLYRN